MKGKIVIFYSSILIVLLCIVIVILNRSGRDTSSYQSVVNPVDRHIPNDYMFRKRAYPTGNPNNSNGMRTRRKSAIIEIYQEEYRESWQPIGPSNISGRITDIEQVSSEDSTFLFVSSASGGIYKSVDDGFTWKPVFDKFSSISIGDMAISKTNPNIIYVGTGEANAGGGINDYDGDGIYKSNDRGKTWFTKGLHRIGNVGKVAIDPQNDTIVYVAAMGSIVASSTKGGIYKTNDGGLNWEKIFSISNKSGAIDLVIDPINPDIIYAAMWERYRTLGRNIFGGETSGIYKSTDAGQNWIKLSLGLPDGSRAGRIGLSIFSSNPDILYTTIADANGYLIGIYKTVDGGQNWTKKNSTNLDVVEYTWWFGKIEIDPSDHETIYHLGVKTQISTDSGNSFRDIFTNAHVDQHAIWISPENSNTLYLGNDGGVYKSMDKGTTSEKLSDLPTIQFYTCEIDNLHPEIIYGGAQDNGVIRINIDDPSNSKKIRNGDGFRVIVDPTDSDIVYAESQNGNLSKSIDGGNTWLVATLGINSDDRNNWNTPIAISSHNSSTLFYSTQRLYKTSDKAETWTAISPDLTKGLQSESLAYATISSINVSPHDETHILVGTDDGNVQITTDSGNSWNLISSSLPNRWVSKVLFDPNIIGTIYVSYSGIHLSPSLFRSSNLGDTWESMTSFSSGMAINDIIVIPNTEEVLIATDAGVFIIDSDGLSLLGKGLANLTVTDLDYHPETKKIVAATYGKSMYTMTLPETSTTSNISSSSINIYPNPATEVLTIEGLTSSKKLLQLINISGEEYISRRIKTNSLTIDISRLPSGIYLLVIHDQSNISTIKKVIIYH